MTIATATPDFLTGFHFECACGEHYRTVGAAASCRKCRNYCAFGRCTHVVDIRTMEVVWGTEPTAEEHEAQVALMTPVWEAERAELRFQIQMWEKEGELYEAEMARQAEEARIAVATALQDQLWEIQDALMGY